MKKINSKIIGILLCVLFLGLFIPTTVAEKQTNDQIQPTTLFPHRLMVFGHISNFIIQGNIIIGHADRLIYYGIGILNRDRGICTNQEIILMKANHCYIWTLGSDLVILGHCIGLLDYT